MCASINPWEELRAEAFERSSEDGLTSGRRGAKSGALRCACLERSGRSSALCPRLGPGETELERAQRVTVARPSRKRSTTTWRRQRRLHPTVRRRRSRRCSSSVQGLSVDPASAPRSPRLEALLWPSRSRPRPTPRGREPPLDDEALFRVRSLAGDRMSDAKDWPRSRKGCCQSLRQRDLYGLRLSAEAIELALAHWCRGAGGQKDQEQHDVHVRSSHHGWSARHPSPSNASLRSARSRGTAGSAAHRRGKKAGGVVASRDSWLRPYGRTRTERRAGRSPSPPEHFVVRACGCPTRQRHGEMR